MNNILPNLKFQKKVCIVCEGYEETEYFERLKSLEVFNHIYDIKLINAKSISSIFAYYQDAFSNKSYDIILAFCDTDKSPSKDYNLLKKKVNKHHASNQAANNVVIFGNPCTMQIYLSHFSNSISLHSHSKQVNAPLIYKLTGVDHYNARHFQREQLFGLINKANYWEMKNNISLLSTNDKHKPSTNLYKYLIFLENNNLDWIYDINHIINND